MNTCVSNIAKYLSMKLHGLLEILSLNIYDYVSDTKSTIKSLHSYLGKRKLSMFIQDLIAAAPNIIKIKSEDASKDIVFYWVIGAAENKYSFLLRIFHEGVFELLKVESRLPSLVYNYRNVTKEYIYLTGNRCATLQEMSHLFSTIYLLSYDPTPKVNAVYKKYSLTYFLNELTTKKPKKLTAILHEVKREKKNYNISKVNTDKIHKVVREINANLHDIKGSKTIMINVRDYIGGKGFVDFTVHYSPELFMITIPSLYNLSNRCSLELIAELIDDMLSFLVWYYIFASYSYVALSRVR